MGFKAQEEVNKHLQGVTSREAASIPWLTILALLESDTFGLT